MFKAINKMKGRKDRGFTLVELLIVVAIIGILAAIAIPQFSAYRIRGFNAAATSDLRNLKIADEAFVTDWQVYASTFGTTGVAGNGGLVTGPQNFAITVAAGAIVTTPPLPSTNAPFTFGVSNGVTAVVNTTTATNAAQYTAGTAHLQGDVIYASDSQETQLKRRIVLKAAGTALQATGVAGGIPASSNLLTDLPTADWSNM